MIITRKIEIYVHEEDKEMKKNYMNTIFGWRDAVREAANIAVSHKFLQQNVRNFMYLQPDVMERFTQEHPDRVTKNKKTGKEQIKYNVSDVIKDEKGLSEQNVTYRLLSSMLKGKVPADIYSCLNQAISKTCKETMTDVMRGDTTLRSYKNNIPMPFSAKALSNIHGVEEDVINTETGKTRKVKRYYFTLFGVPFACFMGHDRSNNDVIIDRCISGEYKMCSSSIAFQKVTDRVTGKKKQKLFLYLCVDMPQKENKLDSKKVMYCYLGLAHPIEYNYEVQAKNIFDSGVKWCSIGDAEEFLYRRVQIQAAMRRCQMNCRWTKGGKGRKRKTQALDRFAEKEKNYVHTKLHTYSRALIDRAVKNGCGTIVLVNQEPREEKAKDDNQKGEPFVLRNWSYFGLKTMIEYKAKMAGIEVISQKEKEDEE